MSDLDAFEPIDTRPRPSRAGPLALAAALLVIAGGVGVALLVLWQWREESREMLADLQASLVSERQIRAIVGERGNAAPQEPAIARAVVDLIKIELPPLLTATAPPPPEPPPPPAEAPAELVMRQTVPFPRVGSDGDGEIERAVATLTSGWRKLPLNGSCELTVDGHTDTKGSDDANRVLSERRAMFVSEILAREFAGAKIKTQGWGERRLQVVTADGVDELANRRVEVTLTCPPH